MVPKRLVAIAQHVAENFPRAHAGVAEASKRSIRRVAATLAADARREFERVGTGVRCGKCNAKATASTMASILATACPGKTHT